MSNNNKIYVSDIIKEEYKEWDNNTNVIIDCMTGQGKTYFTINIYAKHLAKHGKKMLILSNRNKLKENLLIHTEGCKNITVMNYQKLQKDILKGKEIPYYDCIVADECHYFICDSFNKSTDVAWKYIVKQECTKIFMSATGWNVFDMVKKSTRTLYEYKAPRDYSYVNKLIFYKENDYVINTLKALPTESKAIYFSNSKKRGYETYLLFKNEECKASYLCSTGDKEYSDKITKDAIVDEKFASQILITTSCVDNGINLKDRSIKHIFTDIVDIPILLQCLGRKRILDQDDTVTFHIKQHSKKQLNRFINKDKGKLKIAEAYLSKNEVLLSKVDSNRDSLLKECFSGNYVTGKLEFNPMRYIGVKKYIDQLEECCNDGFDKVLLEHLSGIDESRIEYEEVNEDLNKTDKIEMYLQSIVGLKLDKDMKKELVDVINLKDARGRQLKSLSSLNAYISEMEFNYVILQNKSGNMYWIVSEL